MEFVRFMMRDISVSLPLHSSTCCWEGGLLMMELCIWPKCTSSSCAFGVKSRDLRLSIVERKWLWFFSSRLDVISMSFLFHCRDLSATNISMLLNNAFANLHILEELWVNNNVKEPFIFVNNIFSESICRSLAENQLLKIERNSFYGLIKLKRLVLSNCRLMRIPGESFKHLNSLNTLWVFRSLVSFTNQYPPPLRLDSRPDATTDRSHITVFHPPQHSFDAVLSLLNSKDIHDNIDWRLFKRTMNGSNFNCKFVIRTDAWMGTNWSTWTRTVSNLFRICAN